MRLRFRLLVVPAVLAVAACGGSSGSSSSPTSPTTPTTPSTPQTPSTPASPVQTNQVQVGDDFFSPANIQVTPGTTVTWTWNGATTHNVTFTDGGSSSGDKGGSGASFSRTFNAAGTFSYSCTLHGGMNGSVLVKS